MSDQQSARSLKMQINNETLQTAEKGPIQERQCRDVLCCLLFMVNIGAMIYCAVYGYMNGNLAVPFRGSDSLSSVCSDTYPFMYFTGPWGSGFLTNRVCLSSCPTWQATTINCRTNANTPNCNIDNSLDSYTSNDSNWMQTLNPTPPTNPGPDYILGYESTDFLGRMCLPSARTVAKFSQAIIDNFSNMTGSQMGTVTSYLTGAMQDIQNNWPMIIAAVGGAIILSIIYLMLLKCCAGCMVWISIFGSIFAVAGLGVVFFFWSGQLSGLSVGNATIDSWLKSNSTSTYTYYQYFAYTLWGVAGVALIIVFCMCGRVQLAIAVAKAAGSFVAETLSTLIIPFTNAISIVVIWTLCLFGIVYLVASAKFQILPGAIITSIVSYTDEALLRLYYFFFGILWCDALFAAYSFFIISSACALWYYSHGQDPITHTPLLTSIWRGLRYHFGSLVFGALLVAIIEFVRVVYQFVAYQLEKQNPDNKLVQCLLCVGRCFLSCLQCLIEFINRNAYITIAITGKSFCYAAKEGFQIVWSNPIRFAALAGVGRFLSFIGNVFVSFSAAIIFYLILQFTPYKSEVQMPYLMTAIVFLIALVISMVFIFVFTAAMDTIIVCFILDQKVQQVKGRPQSIHAPPEIVDILTNVDKD